MQKYNKCGCRMDGAAYNDSAAYNDDIAYDDIVDDDRVINNFTQWDNDEIHHSCVCVWLVMKELLSSSCCSRDIDHVCCCLINPLLCVSAEVHMCCCTFADTSLCKGRHANLIKAANKK